tara:strand:- start:320 stop:1033 length:714 start_codon:yes stop_codon:yes gene_type:complete
MHLVAFTYILFSSPSDGGGGGKVVGQLSVHLGGSGAAGPSEVLLTETVVEPTVQPPAPRVEEQQAPEVEAVAPKQRVVQAKPVLRRPAEILRVSELTEPAAPVRQEVGERGDGNPVGSASAGAPSLGEGAASQTAGIGSSEASAGDQRDAYLALIRARIEKNRTYPSAARRKREEGMATITITIDARGDLTQVQLVAGSGSFHLDRAAKRMAEKSAPFPPPPVTPFSTQIPIVFTLR